VHCIISFSGQLSFPIFPTPFFQLKCAGEGEWISSIFATILSSYMFFLTTFSLPAAPHFVSTSRLLNFIQPSNVVTEHVRGAFVNALIRFHVGPHAILTQHFPVIPFFAFHGMGGLEIFFPPLSPRASKGTMAQHRSSTPNEADSSSHLPLFSLPPGSDKRPLLLGGLASRGNLCPFFIPTRSCILPGFYWNGGLPPPNEFCRFQIIRPQRVPAKQA